MAADAAPHPPASSRLAVLLSMSMFVLVVDTSLMNVSAGRRRPSVIIRAGFALVTIGTLVLIPVVPRADTGWWLVVALLVSGSGLGLLVSQLNDYTLSPISEERVSEAAGVNSAAGSFGPGRRGAPQQRPAQATARGPGGRRQGGDRPHQHGRAAPGVAGHAADPDPRRLRRRVQLVPDDPCARPRVVRLARGRRPRLTQTRRSDHMCRWMAWLGQPVLIEELLFNTQHGIVDQSLHSRMGAETTNGDGFGMGWYDAGRGPGLYHSVTPAWADPNLRELAAHIESPLFLAHVRAAIGSAVQQTNCHPFRRGNWLFVHNGYVADVHALRRDLMLAIDPGLFDDVRGSTDTEMVFHLALTLGLEEDPIGAMERTVGLIEATGRAHGLSGLVQGTFGISDGETLWAVRYATEGPARTLFASSDVDAIHSLYPENARLARLGPDDRLIVSEPFADLPGLWHEIPQSSAVTVHYGGELDHQPFQPRATTVPV